MNKSRLLPVVAFILLITGCPQLSWADAPAPATLEVQFIDSATGGGIRAGQIMTHSPALGTSATIPLETSGRLSLALPEGVHQVTVLTETHQPFSGQFKVSPDSPAKIRIFLDPLEEPLAMRPESISARRRSDAMLIQGFVVDDASGQPLSGVRVSSLPSGAAAQTDASGFFEFYLPADSTAPSSELVGSEAGVTLSFVSEGYQTQERLYLETWPGGDWTYRIRLQKGAGHEVVDERLLRRRTSPAADTSATGDLALSDPVPATATGPSQESAPTPEFAPPDIQFATAPSNATVRVPRNIRVLRSDNVTIDYVSLTYYARCVLPSEWIASWGSYIGGSNSLNAGAVAARCYAIGRLNNVSSSSTYDICATTSCQVYDPSRIHSLTDIAVNFTENVVLLAGTTIPATEYSAENNSYDPSLSFSCPDGFTAPTGGCVYDPVCTGQVRYGHGRGMCQWGSARWATGRRMANRSSADATPNGYPRRDWIWILQHYYPTLTLAKGAPLIIGDDVKALKTLDVRACAGGDIANGTSCALVTTKAAGATGVIIGGPVVITADGKGFTWYRIQWNDAGSTTGWSVENYLDRVFSVPSAPNSLAAVANGSHQINLSWTDTTDLEAGFKIERAPGSTGPWIRIATVNANTTSYSDASLAPGSTGFYRVQAYNAGGGSGFSGPAGATTAWSPPAFAAIPSQAIDEQMFFTINLNASANESTQLITDFEAWPSETANGIVLFRTPRYSGSTSPYLNTAPDIAAITDAYRTNGHGAGQVLRISCDFAAVSNPWLRLTTSGTATLGNPVIDFTRQLRFDVFSDKPIGIAIGCRETVTAPGTTIGSDGGSSGSSIEWAGATGKAGTAPITTRTITASNWTTVTFDLPSEPVTSFSGGNGVLSTASGLGTLEHVAIVPAAGPGPYNIFLDNFQVVTPGTVAFSLAEAPAGASLNPSPAQFSWVPTELQGPGSYPVSIVATDNHVPPGRTTNTFALNVLEVNTPPSLTALPDLTVHAGMAIVFTNTASDADLPPNTLSFSLDPVPPPGSGVGAGDGVFSWTPSDAHAGTTNLITVRVNDNGNPILSDTESFLVRVQPRPDLQAASYLQGETVLAWTSIPGLTYRLEYKDDLNTPAWTAVTPDIPATTTTSFATNTPAGPSRFYRVRVITP